MTVDEKLSQIAIKLSDQANLLEAIRDAPAQLSDWLPFFASIASVTVAAFMIRYSRISAKEQLESSERLLEKQLKANVVAMSRREWMNALRREISDHLSNAKETMHAITSSDIDTINKTSHKAVRCHTYIQLLLDPDKDKHTDLLKALDVLTDEIRGIIKLYFELKNVSEANKEAHIKSMDDGLSKCDDLSADISVKTSRIIEDSWGKVKNLE